MFSSCSWSGFSFSCGGNDYDSYFGGQRESMGTSGTGTRFILELRHMTDVPDLDIDGSGSDIQVKGMLLDADGENLGRNVNWPVMNDLVSPVWNKVRIFQQAFDPDNFIKLSFADVDMAMAGVRGREKIGKVTVKCSELEDMQEHIFTVELSKRALQQQEIERKKQKKAGNAEAEAHVMCKVALRLRAEPTPKKVVYFIRHGESKWNKAQSKMRVGNMLKEFDHGLSADGRDQAEDLNKVILAAQQSSQTSQEATYAAEFLSATTIYSSPLTRAIQTGMIGLKSHPTMRKQGVTLVRDARESKNLGGFDTHGIAKGAAIRQRVLKEMLTLYDNENSEDHGSSKLLGDSHVFAIDPNDAMNVWWTITQDAASEVKERQMDLLQKLACSSEEVMIVVGHSLFFREVYKEFACQEAKELAKQEKNSKAQKEKKQERAAGAREASTAHAESESECSKCCLAQLGKLKMENCAVVRCELDFSSGLGECITRAQMMFGTKMIKKGTKDDDDIHAEAQQAATATENTK